jgi:hypothetical protein
VRRTVPVRTFGDWNEPPGYVEVDLVAHGGTSVAGSFVQTVVLTDVATGWTECVPILVREGALVVEALGRARELFPFALKGAVLPRCCPIAQPDQPELHQLFDLLGGRTRTRTLDPLIKSQLLYHLSYAPSAALARSVRPARQPGRSSRGRLPGGGAGATKASGGRV